MSSELQANQVERAQERTLSSTGTANSNAVDLFSVGRRRLAETPGPRRSCFLRL